MSVIIYIKPTCPYCKKALLVLRRKGVAITEVDIAANPNRRQEMIDKAGKSTVPQIFVRRCGASEDYHIGGCDELLALDRAGKLDEVLV